MMIIGLTGGIGSGKSTVAGFFRDLGVPVYDSDKEAKILMVESSEVREAIIAAFGSEAYNEKKLNKTFLSHLVFADKNKLNQLNGIVHPAVRKHFLQWVAKQNSAYVIQETALIFENGVQDNYDATILVTSPENLRIQRVMKRDGMSESQVKARMANQMPDEQKISIADFVIENRKLEETKKIVGRIHKKLIHSSMPKSKL